MLPFYFVSDVASSIYVQWCIYSVNTLFCSISFCNGVYAIRAHWGCPYHLVNVASIPSFCWVQTNVVVVEYEIRMIKFLLFWRVYHRNFTSLERKQQTVVRDICLHIKSWIKYNSPELFYRSVNYSSVRLTYLTSLNFVKINNEFSFFLQNSLFFYLEICVSSM